MPDRLPPGLPVPPPRQPVVVPPEGADEVASAARRLRRRRAGAASLSATTLTVVVALFATAGSPGSARLQLDPAGVPPPPAARATAPAQSLPQPPGTAAPSGPADQPTARPRPSQEAHATTRPVTPAAPAHSEPMRRMITDRPFGCPGPTTRACVSVAAPSRVRSGQRAEVAVDVCVPQTALQPLTVTFTTSREADVTISPQGSRDAAWRWSYGRRFERRRSTIVVPPGWCYRWLTAWNTRGDDGRLVPRGTYVAVPWTEAPGVPVVPATVQVV